MKQLSIWLKKLSIKTTFTAIIISSIVILIDMTILSFIKINNFIVKIVLCATLLIAILVLLTFFLKLVNLVFFKGKLKERFNETSLFMCLGSTVTLAPLVLFLLIIVIGKAKIDKDLKTQVVIATLIIVGTSIISWIVYLIFCRKVIKEIKTDSILFLTKMIWSMLTAIFVCFSSTVVILLLSKKDSNMTVLYQLLNICINAFSPLIQMYIYVRKELDKFLDKFIEENKNNCIPM